MKDGCPYCLAFPTKNNCFLKIKMRCEWVFSWLLQMTGGLPKLPSVIIGVNLALRPYCFLNASYLPNRPCWGFCWACVAVDFCSYGCTLAGCCLANVTFQNGVEGKAEMSTGVQLLNSSSSGLGKPPAAGNFTSWVQL